MALESPTTALKQIQIIGQVCTETVLRKHSGERLSFEKAMSKNPAAQPFECLSGNPKNSYMLEFKEPPYRLPIM
ncbi:MAG TPA: hypothetical protein DCL66_14910 [Gammaproteobacteria bacterium]|nr:hypothetical protein [Gammaproteobacteria bacterium]